MVVQVIDTQGHEAMEDMMIFANPTEWIRVIRLDAIAVIDLQSERDLETSAIAARKKRASDKEDDSDEEKEDKDEEEEKNDEEIKKEIAEGEEDETSAKKANDKDDASDKEDKSENKDESSTRKTFIKLNCPHCGIKAVTFRKYDLHLQGRTHMMAMRKVSIKQKSILAQMRLAQRNAQNELEKTSDDLAPRTNFCPLCKLNYKQRKAVHQNSEAHKNMKKFLMPYCKLCSITFKSPMMYESHCCSIEHLKRKQRVENGENSDEFDDETNLENFTTIDSVGIDGDASEEDDKKDINKEPVSVGIEQIRKVEAYYCDLCKMYVGRGNDEMIPSILARHCKQRTHMQRYIRYKEDKDLEKRAEKLQRKETAEKEDKERQNRENNVEDSETNQKQTETSKEEKDEESANKTLDDEEARDDKLWADVDKDLDDILAKEGTKSSDEDEDVNGERYDRFKYSEKNGDEKTVKKEGEDAEVGSAEKKDTVPGEK
ncbi:zinc finger protein on ecdysone puffs-like isoform X2 [Zophobas morio]|uniref:zinc finger protein on ecdysone puffs-like isoform X2 n=1 Tax=Zophobas morio TaxID=2755281 RepID=UPI003082F097